MLDWSGYRIAGRCPNPEAVPPRKFWAILRKKPIDSRVVPARLTARRELIGASKCGLVADSEFRSSGVKGFASVSLERNGLVESSPHILLIGKHDSHDHEAD